MATKSEELKMFTFDQIKDEFIGETGSKKRMQYEQWLQLEVLREMICPDLSGVFECKKNVIDFHWFTFLIW